MSGPSDKAPEASDTAPATSDTGPGQVGPDAAMASIRAARRALLGATHGVWPRYVSLNESTDLLEALHFAAAELEKLIAAEPVSRAMAAIVAVAVKRNAVAEEWARVTEEKGSDHQAYDVAANAFDAEDAALDDAVDAYLEAEKAARIQAGLMTADEIRRLEGAEPGGLLSGDVSDCTVEEVLQTIEEIRAAPTAPSTAPSYGTSCDWKLMPRYPSQEMMDAGLYQSSADAEWDDVFSAYVDMWEAAPEPEDYFGDTTKGASRKSQAHAAPSTADTVAVPRSMLAPFVAEAENWADSVPDDYRPLCTEPGKKHAYPGSDTSYSVGDVRRLAAHCAAAPSTAAGEPALVCGCGWEGSYADLNETAEGMTCPKCRLSRNMDCAATPPAQAAATLADRLLAAGVDLERDKPELLALLRPDAVWPFDMREWSTETLSEALADANWMEPVAIQRGYVGATVWAVRIPIGDSEGMVEDEEFRVFATEEAAKDYCRGAEECGQ